MSCLSAPEPPFTTCSGIMDSVPFCSPPQQAHCYAFSVEDTEGTPREVSRQRHPVDQWHGCGATQWCCAQPPTQDVQSLGDLQGPRWLRSQGPHNMAILCPLHRHPDPSPPACLPRSSCPCSPRCPNPIAHPVCQPPAGPATPPAPRDHFLLAPCLQTSSRPAFQQPALNDTISNYICTPALGKGPLPSASFLGSTPSA